MKPGIYLATTYSHRTYRPTTIGAAAFHFRVRNGTGWFRLAVVTRGQPCLTGLGLCRPQLRRLAPALPCRSLTSTWRSILPDIDPSELPRDLSYSNPWHRFRWNQANRMISTGKLNPLPNLHFQPINVVVSDDPSGKTHLGRSLALRCFQRLSLPHLATQPCR